MDLFTAKCIFFLKNICTILVFVVTLQAKNLEHKFERNTILEYEKVIYNSFTDAIISKHHGHRFLKIVLWPSNPTSVLTLRRVDTTVFINGNTFSIKWVEIPQH